MVNMAQIETFIRWSKMSKISRLSRIWPTQPKFEISLGGHYLAKKIIIETDCQMGSVQNEDLRPKTLEQWTSATYLVAMVTIATKV